MRALQAAKHACEASGWSLTNLQLQKILYLAHMVHLGQTGEPLVNDEFFEAWAYGPVLPSVYHHVSGFGSRPIANIFATVAPSRKWRQVESIEEAVDQFADVEPFRLVEILHDDRSAWNIHYNPQDRGVIIPDEDIIDEYRNRFE